MTMLARHWNEAQIKVRAAQPPVTSRLRSRATRWIVVTAKKVYLAIVVLGGCAALLAAAIALGVVIWVPLNFHP